VYSNAVTTVSPTYASDVLNAGAGGFLKPVFNQDHVSCSAWCSGSHMSGTVPFAMDVESN
jgi:hypothetical protein